MDNNEIARQALEKLNKLQEALKIKLAADPAPGDPAPEGKTLNAKDGSVYKTIGEPAEGMEIMMVGTDGEVPAPDGAIELEDGSVINVKDGKIESITASPLGPDPAPADNAAKMQALMAGLDPSGTSTDPIVVMLKALMESTFGWEIREQTQKAAREAAIKAYQTQLSSQESEIKALKLQLSSLHEARKAENAEILAMFQANLEAIDAVAKAPIGGEAKKQIVFPKTEGNGGPLGRKAGQA
jgi:hypothetical protein